MRYYLIYMDKYYPYLKCKYKNAIQVNNVAKEIQIIYEVQHNRNLTEKQKGDIIRQLKYEKQNSK